jgi:hypothetical protein
VLSAGGSGPGAKQFGFTVSANGGAARDGSITIQDKTVSIHQDGFACTFALVGSQTSFGSSGGSGTVGVTAPNACAWTPSSDSAWIAITSGPGAGNGAISFTVAANTTASARTGHISVGDQSVTIAESVGPVITAASVQGKQLIVTGVNFVDGALLFVDGAKQKKTANDPGSPATSIIAKKSGRWISSGQLVMLQVQNPDGKLSPQFGYQRP